MDEIKLLTANCCTSETNPCTINYWCCQVERYLHNHVIGNSVI
ncbi:MAG: hypothetical protein Dasosvirus5_11 [Dasosvirus sp.]|uniref:Uncharacterized protein n=1 Tax=Dasosvirus sp. TaxID=2487764 RepID=A0A3G4ZRJ7_9VIRU|nr:MAG: hypothetical protein Dasosvirus5_11 [Dasosvirus sp.]